MTKVEIICPTFTNNPNDWYYIRESAKINNLKLNVYGLGRGYPWLMEFIEVAELCDNTTCPYVLWTNAYDVLVNHWDEYEVIRNIENQRSKLFISCEDNCYPSGPWCEAYTYRQTPWYACNGGQFCGTKEAVAALCREFISGKWMHTGGFNQEMLHQMKASGRIFGMDNNCRIFQSMSGKSPDYIRMLNGKAFNIFTNTTPMFLHFNGRTPGIEQWFNNIYSGENK